MWNIIFTVFAVVDAVALVCCLAYLLFKLECEIARDKAIKRKAAEKQKAEEEQALNAAPRRRRRAQRNEQESE